MNWKKLLLNIGAAAAGGFSTAVATSGTGGLPNKQTLVGAILMPVIVNLLGLFQAPPHQDA